MVTTILASLDSFVLEWKLKYIDEDSWTVGLLKETCASMKVPGVNALEAIVTAS